MPHVLALGIILLVAAGLRLWNIGQESLWADEALTVVLANWPIWEMIWYPADESPFLYYALHKLLIAPGAGPEMVRSISAVAGLLSVLATYALGRLALGRNAGLLCAALLAVWPYHIDYSQEARAYSLLFLLTTTSAASLLWWFRETEPREGTPGRGSGKRHLALALFALSTALTFYTHVLSVIWIAVILQVLVSLTSRTRPKRCLLEVGIALAAMAILAAPGIVRLSRKLSTPDAFHWLPQATPVQFVQTVIDVLSPFRTGSQPWVAERSLSNPWQWLAVGAIIVVVVGLGLAARRVLSRAAQLRPAVAIGLALLSLPLIVWLFGYFIRPVFMPRTILFAIPGMILLLAASIGLIRNLKLRVATALACVGIYLVATLVHGTVREKEDWAGANAFLARHMRPGDLLLLCPFWKFPAARHAATSAAPVPALVPGGGSLLLLERSYGSDANWSEHFFDNVTSTNRMLFRAARPNAEVKASLSAPADASLWLVSSECDPQAEADVAALAGPGATTSMQWSSQSASERDAITIRRITLARPLVTQVDLRGGAAR